MTDVERKVQIQSPGELYRAIENSGLSILIAHLTEQTELSNLPYKVVRVLIQGMIPMNFGHGIESLGLDRVRSLPVKCGLLDQATDADKLNRFPHPFT